MIDVVLIFNGLGNQMSQYAFFLAKREEQKNKVISVSFLCPNIEQHNGFELEKVFGIKDVKSPNSLIGKISKIKGYSRSKIGKKRQALEIIFSILSINDYNEHPLYNYEPHMLNKGKSIISLFYGGWHSEKYYLKIRNTIKKTFIFDENKIDKVNLNISHKMQIEESVSVHIRRGDYVGSSIFDGICTKEYYYAAINYIKKITPPHQKPLHFYIFSDDNDYAKKIISEPNSTYLSINSGEDSWKDMFLMTKCKHNINANSTFSWWGAWLNDNPGKVVIVPEKFFKYGETKDFYPEDWIKIKV